jgi:peroxiredoxin
VQLNIKAKTINDLGYKVAAISYDSVEALDKFTKRRMITFTLLSDKDSAVIKTYGLLDPQYAPDQRAYGVPRPIILILDTQGVVKAKFFEAEYVERPHLPDVIETLKTLK